MPSTTRRRPPSSTRTEARRRARQRADAEAGTAGSERTGDSRGGRANAGSGAGGRPTLLERFVPYAPPLPGKPDALARFAYGGPALLRPLAVAAFLLRANPLAWILPGLVWSAARFLGALGLIVALVEFGALIAAGAFGWQRPWLYGFAAGIFGVVVLVAIATTAELAAGTDPAILAGRIPAALFYFAVLQGFTGALAGWFGGYWRRRLVHERAAARTRR